MSSDDLISQFMVFTGCDDGERALQYLEMSNMNVETAVSLYMEHEHQGSGAVDSALPAQVRAPDRTQTMRLMDDVGIPNMGMSMYDGMIEDQDVVMSAFARIDARSAVNAAAAEIVHDTESTDHVDQLNVRTDEANTSANLTDLFAPPTHLLHRGGGFQGARTIARDVRRWLLVNIQRDSEFACHALNRDVWRDELVENLIREGFIFWQANHDSSEGQKYVERYKVHDYPHIAIIDPRTGRLLWSKEGWTQVRPFTAEQFAEMAMDFCSRHSFDKDPAPLNSKKASDIAVIERKRPFMSEEEEIRAAMAASLGHEHDLQSDDDDEKSFDEMDGYEDEWSRDGSEPSMSAIAKSSSLPGKQNPERNSVKTPSFLQILLSTEIGREPLEGARVQLRLPDATRIIRRFSDSEPVKVVYAFVAQSIDDAKNGKEFILMAGFPPRNMIEDLDTAIGSYGLNGQTVTVRWKD